MVLLLRTDCNERLIFPNLIPRKFYKAQQIPRIGVYPHIDATFTIIIAFRSLNSDIFTFKPSILTASNEKKF